MTQVAYRASSITNSAGTTNSVTRSANIQGQDLIHLIQIVYDNLAVTSTPPSGFVAPAGFTAPTQGNSTTGQIKVFYYTKRAGGTAGSQTTDASSFTCTNSSSLYQELILWSTDGHEDATTPILAVTTNTGTAATVTALDPGTAPAQSLEFWIHAGYSNALTATPSGFTAIVANQDAVNDIYYKQVSGSTGNTTATQSTADPHISWIALAILVQRSKNISVDQSAQTTATGTGTTLAQAYTGAVAAGSTLCCFVECLDATSETIAVSDSVNGSWGAAVQSINDGTKTVAQFQLPNTLAGTPTVTATFGVTTTLRAIWIQEIINAAVVSLDGFNGQTQAAPGAGTDAITSGTATNANQPALILALSSDHRTVSPVAPASGTNFTDNGAGWTFAGGNQARLESQRITTTTAVAATFTGTTGVVPTTLMAIFDELGAGGLSGVSIPTYSSYITA